MVNRTTPAAAELLRLLRPAAPLCLLLLLPLLLAAEGAKEPPIKQLDGLTRAKMLTALAGLIITGFVLILLVRLAMRAARRYLRTPNAREKPSPYSHFGVDDWASKPLVPAEDPGEAPEEAT